MKSKIKQSLFLIIASLLAVFFIVITVKQIDFERVAEVLKQTNYFWIFASMAISILTYWIRAARWNLLLKPMGYHTQTSSGFWAIAFAYFMNLTIPRSGEVARATSFYKMENVPFEKSFGTVVLERVIDVLFLGFVFGLTLLFNYETFIRFVELGHSEKAHHTNTEPSFLNYYITLGIIILGIILIIFFRKKMTQLAFFDKIKTFFLGLWEGIKSISKLEKKGLFLFYSFALWICYFLMTYLVFFAFPDTKEFGIPEGLFLLIAGSLGMILPVSGGLAYPYIMSIAFSAVYLAKGGDQHEGRAIGDYFGLILYIAQVISMISFGLIAIYKIARIRRDSTV
ncbi:lysylphosphatidylglycerol synthase transmembrane domain-containing protein [Empedobacter brevis]|uniref:Membrane protein n=1 Tax=Empedobacter brevis NBRC 14943 = ATCC 43319 TaxID=1218108 RepID=A0A511NKU3_9FLAO|nr:lysylphosphatidylglycerol synthase transmembrane domain-containing protein [Empedobacter brevis]GEM53420.1 membrane protein [Empedobacter brevis NBRC 14943 = ATCC 43319]